MFVFLGGITANVPFVVWLFFFLNQHMMLHTEVLCSLIRESFLLFYSNNSILKTSSSLGGSVDVYI